ncbi:hypothetical protein KII97_02475 [Leuconostoc gelidum subsp. gasicomitatum]|uniref:hypothetical protein n=1 Tax=Leuconostoc gasicomitatum TaxID=115778 RepID=UPI001CC4981D|nr:hypothetical protein [Leuconostoc gasicomitatum]MBZ5995373.1 hypothetical protein [Leuconostoc gasicomitatum]
MIKMTREQYEQMMAYKRVTWFSLFIKQVNESMDLENTGLPLVNAFDDWGVSIERETDLMKAWISPEDVELVEVTDEQRD